MTVHTPAQFAHLLMNMVAHLPMAEHAALEHACVIVETEVKRVHGTYDYGWPQLAESTQARRDKAGYPPNEPLLVTAELRESYGHKVVHTGRHLEGTVGSNEDKALWHNLGTARVPARPTLVPAALRKRHEIEHAVGRAMHGFLSTGKVHKLIP